MPLPVQVFNFQVSHNHCSLYSQFIFGITGVTLLFVGSYLDLAITDRDILVKRLISGYTQSAVIKQHHKNSVLRIAGGKLQCNLN